MFAKIVFERETLSENRREHNRIAYDRKDISKLFTQIPAPLQNHSHNIEY